jgi:hypothetical protein
MKKSTGRKIRETAKKGATKTYEVAGKVKGISRKTVTYAKGKLPSERKVKDAARVTAKFATKVAFSTKDKTKKIAGAISKTSRGIVGSVKEGIAEAKKENSKKNR